MADDRNVGEIDGIPVRITDHALYRMTEMGVNAEMFKQLLLEPEERYESRKYPGSWYQRRGRYALALRKSDKNVYVVTTVVYTTLANWLKASRDDTLGGVGREEARLNTGIPRF